jgi:succinate-semialdehyde dehydrogenase/glutarate-semialdehyde dehydrogenase
MAEIIVTNPVTGAEIGRITAAARGEVQAAVERARAAQPAWEALGVQARARLLRRWADLIWDDQETLLDTICAETGKARVGAFNELFVFDNTVSYYTHRGARILRPQTRRGLFPIFQPVRVHYRPHGVVGFITPWNYPFVLAFCDIIPALIAGNTAVIKPSEVTPFSAHYGVEMLRKAGVPAGVVQLVDGAGETGSALVDFVDYISFTGSTAVGKKVAVQAAQRLIPYSLELGGKDPLIVLRDADLDQASAGTLIGALENAGQVCTSVERVYVEAPIYDEFLDQLRQRIAGLAIGTTYAHHVGSLTNERELLRTETHVADAVSKGARIISGGKRRPELGPLFFEPAILADVDHSMAVMQEETFGPLVAVMRVADAEEAIRLANDSPYGLSGTIYTRNMQRGERLARQIDSGDVSLNRPLAIWGASDAPMGGQKSSGIGRRGGPEGLLRFVTPQSIVLDRVPRLLFPPDLVHLTPRMRRLVGLRRRLVRYLPFLRP